MSDVETFKVEVATIKAIEPHPNADKLELATVFGWQCVVQKGRYQPGDIVVYIPIDSVLPSALEERIFGPDSKVKLHNHRVKTIKLRGAISQGLVVDRGTCGVETAEPGDNVTKELGITKYEPPAAGFQQHLGTPPKTSYKNPFFKTYTKFPNYKYYTDLFRADEHVVFTEKIHGTNFRAGWVPFHANTMWRKILKFFKLAPEWVFVYGSHNVQISEKPDYKGFYEKNVYAEMVVKYDLKNRIPKGRVIYGEIFGEGIQKGYDYGIKGHDLVLFDIMDTTKAKENGEFEYLNYYDFRNEVDHVLKMKRVPQLFEGLYGNADVQKLIDGNSVMAPSQKVREGAVVKTVYETSSIIGRKALKIINPEYLLSDPTEFH